MNASSIAYYFLTGARALRYALESSSYERFKDIAFRLSPSKSVEQRRFSYSFGFLPCKAANVSKSYDSSNSVNYRDDERRGLDVGVTPATLVREVVAGTPSIMGG